MCLAIQEAGKQEFFDWGLNSYFGTFFLFSQALLRLLPSWRRPQLILSSSGMTEQGGSLPGHPAWWSVVSLSLVSTAIGWWRDSYPTQYSLAAILSQWLTSTVWPLGILFSLLDRFLVLSIIHLYGFQNTREVLYTSNRKVCVWKYTEYYTILKITAIHISARP